jgi:hypothetical protein
MRFVHLSDGAYLYIPLLYHAPLRGYRDDVFFKICRLHNVTYDPVHKTGVLFFLVDAVASGVLSMLVMGAPTLPSEEIEAQSATAILPNSDTGKLIAASRVAVMQTAVTTLSFIYQNFGKVVADEPPAPNSTSDQIAASSCYSLSTVLSRLKSQLKKEQKALTGGAKK